MFHNYSEGEKIVCIDNRKTLYLSQDKIYRVVCSYGEYVQVEDDGGYLNGFEARRFESLYEKRKGIISQLL